MPQKLTLSSFICVTGCRQLTHACDTWAYIVGRLNNDQHYWPKVSVCFNQDDHKPGKPGVLRDFYEHGKLWEFCATSGKIINKQNSFSLIKYLRNTTRFRDSNEQSLVNLGDGDSVLVTCRIARVDVE